MNTCTHRLISILLAVAAIPALAADAYTWTDSTGVTHFSETAPPGTAQDAERVELKSAPVIPGPPPERYRSISDQAARLQADREKRELARAKRRQREASTQMNPYDDNGPEHQPDAYLYYPPPYWYPPRPPHHNHPRHPHPRHQYHPERRDWFGAGRTITQKRNAQALRDRRRRW